MLKYSQCTDKELEYTYPEDKYIDKNSILLYRAISVNASSVKLFQWVSQMRFAPYSYDWIDNGGKKSPQYIIPSLPELKNGDAIMRIFTLINFRKNEFLSFTIPDTAPSYLRIPLKLFAKSFYITYQLFPVEENKTRLVVKIIVNSYQTFFHSLFVKIADIADYIMMRKQLLNFKRLAESS